ncbi:MAG: CAP domain-containing protein [Planctomycetes bacterium]|nr:CAP domain-containing protein [Planctomycetota bacterium]
MIFAASALFLCPWALEPAAPPQEVRVRRSVASLLKELRRGEDFVVRGAVVEALMERGPDGQRRLAEEAASKLRGLAGPYQGLRQRCNELAAGWIGEWRDRPPVASELEEIAAARAVVNRVVSEPPGRVLAQAELDRALGRLSLRLELDPAAAAADDPELSRTAAELAAVVDLGAEYRRYWEGAAAALAAGGEQAAERKDADPPPDPVTWTVELGEDLGRLGRSAWRLSAADQAVLAANLDGVTPLSREEREVVHGVNRLRYLAGLPLLRVVPGLNRACRNHVADMVELGFHSHDSPVPGRESYWQRAEQEGAHARNENLNQGAASAEEAIATWWRSFGHRKALMGPYRDLGVAHQAPHWVCLFD